MIKYFLNDQHDWLCKIESGKKYVWDLTYKDWLRYGTALSIPGTNGFCHWITEEEAFLYIMETENV